MKIKRLFLLLIAVVFASDTGLASAVDSLSAGKRPTVGVVLCGGGAKGFAHIRVLKMIDEAGIPIDYIGGTSIGSIIGGLYAVGYDPDMMEKLVCQQDWNRVIYDNIPEIYSPIENKINGNNFITTLPITGGKVKTKYSLKDGVYVNLLMSRLTLPAYNIRDFSKLSVPFYCIATDVEKATQYELNKGSLSRSIRASMAIPFFFSPIRIDDRLLVDGGLVNNFPVRNMEEKGVDIIIGVDLEDATIPADEIDSSLGLLSCMLNLSSLQESQYAKSHCDIYIRPDLHGRNLFSFDDYDSILYFGETAAREFYPKLKSLADSLYNIEPFTIKRPHTQPVDHVNIIGIDVVGVPEGHEIYLKREFGTDFPRLISVDYIEEQVLKLSMSGYYKDVWYELIDTPCGVYLRLHCTEISDMSLSFAMHYDNNYGIGVLTNFLLRNTFNSLNRVTLNVDLNIAECPFVKIRYNKRHGRIFSYGSEAIFNYVRMDQFSKNQISNAYSIQNNRLDLYSSIVIGLTQQIRLGTVFDYAHMNDLVGINELRKRYEPFTYLYFNYFFQNEDFSSFASKGFKINILSKFLFYEGVYSSGKRQPLFIVHGDMVKTFPFTEKSSFKLGIEAASKIGRSEMPSFYKFYVGGQSKMNYFDNIISFTGLEFVNTSVNYLVFGKLAWQYNIYKKLYGIVNVDFGYMSSYFDEWFDDANFTIGYGITVGANTPIGPLELSFMGSNMNKGPIGFINVGYWF
ncbi:MAG: patatin-like phospholipase family protein [Candidatus Limimorpha sp.]